MRVLHVIPSMAPSFGGPSAAMRMMAQALTAEAISIHVVSADNDSPTSPDLATSPNEAGFVHIRFPFSHRQTRYSPSLASWLSANIRNFDLVHIHGVFNHPCLAAERSSFKNRIPFIVRPLGILNRWGMQSRNALPKRLWFRFLEKPLLDHAAAIHFTAEEEAVDVSRLAIRAPAVILPLGLDISAFQNLPSPTIFRDANALPKDRQIILFLSRIHPKKGIDLLLLAFANVLKTCPLTHLVIAGDGDQAYISRLKQQAASLGLTNHVTWTGFLDPSSRLSALATADVFCLPSWSENFGVALLEAMAAGRPCLASDQVALANPAAKAGAVYRTQCDADAITSALIDLLSNPLVRQELGQRAANFARERYDLKLLGRRLFELYSKILSTVPA